MPKRRLKLDVRLPLYPGRGLADPNAISKRVGWRADIKKAARRALGDREWPYKEDDMLELDIRLYLASPRAVGIHDVDNRLKDIMDALQGAVGVSKAQRKRSRRLIENDRQIWKVTIEKMLAPKGRGGGGHLTIGKYKPRFVSSAAKYRSATQRSAVQPKVRG
jgi:hypothetical protein